MAKLKAEGDITRVHNSVALKIRAVDSDSKRSDKTYNNVRTNAPNDAIYAVYEAIAGLMAKTAENCFVVATDELIMEE